MHIHKQLKVGIVGLGHQAINDHIPAVISSHDVDLVGVAECDEKRLEDFKNSNISIPAFNSVDDLIKNVVMDIIIITVPHYLHYEITKKALDKGINVLKEKPFAISLKQAVELRELSDNNKAHIFITAQRRFNPIYSTFLQLIDKIGDPFYIDSKYTIFTDEPHLGWRADKKMSGGGCVIDMGYHMVDLLMWYFGLPDKVFAEMSCEAKENIEYDAEDTARIVFKYERKSIWGSLMLSRVIPPKQEYFDVYGTRGFIHIERGKIEHFSPDGLLYESLSRQHSWPSAFQDQIEYFVKVINGERKSVSSPEMHFKHLAFIESVYESKRIGSYVDPRNIMKAHNLTE